MSKAADMAKISAKGSFHMLWGLAASTVISAVGTIIISILLGEDNFGLYSIALMAPNLIMLFRDWGVSFAMIRYTAQNNAENKTENIKGIFLSGLIFETVLGVALSLAGFFLSGFLATVIFNRPNIAPIIQIASFIVLTNALISTATAAFTGVEKMHLNSIMVVSQSIIKTVLVIVLVLFGLGTYGAITGVTLASLLAGIIGVLLMFSIYRGFPSPENKRLNIRGNIRSMLSYGVPLSVSTILAGFLLQYYNFLMANSVADNALIGNFAIAQNFVVLITFFAQPVITMMFPAFSKLDAKRDHDTLMNVFRFSVKYASLLVVPATVLVMSMSIPAIGTIYQNRYSVAPLFLALLAINYLYSAFGFLSAPSLINSQGETRFTMKVGLLTAAVGLPLGYVLISQFGVLGLIVTTLAYIVPSIVVNLLFIQRRFKITVNWVSSAKILASSAIAGLISYIVVSVLAGLPALGLLILGVGVFLVVYVVAAVLTRTIDGGDIDNLRNMVSALGPVGRVLGWVLRLIEKLIVFSGR